MLQKIRDSVIRWVGGIILALLAVAFVFWGVNPSLTGTTFAAKVNGEEVSLAEFDRELQYQQNQYTTLYRAELTDELRREIRRNVIDRLVRNMALRQHVKDMGYRISDERVVDSIRSVAAFQVGGEFSNDVYRAQLANEGISPSYFESQQRERLMLIELQNGITDSTFLTPAEFRRYIEVFNQRRELGYALFQVQAFSSEAATDEAEIAAHYEANKDQYRTLETVDLEYIELKRADIIPQIEVTEAQLEAYYEEQKDRFVTQEERRASHILITAGADDPQAEAKAQSILERVEGGEDFATVAREVSDDGGTKDAGGELGWISRGMLAGPFEDALFDMKPGEIRGPIKTQFGYHIIRLEEIKAGAEQPFEEVREQLATEYKEQHAEDLFYEEANQLTDHAFDAFSELATVATQMNLPLQTLMGFPRSGDPSVFANSAPVVQAAFSPEVLEQGANSGLVELADDDVLVLRVSAHHPSEQQSLEAVHDDIAAELVHAHAEQLASAGAGEFFAALEAGGAEADPAALAEEHGGKWNAARWIDRTAADLPTEVLAAAFRMRKPAPEAVHERVGLASGDQAVLVLSAVELGQPEAVEPTQRDQRLKQLADQAATYELAAYAEDLADKASVRVPEEIVNPPVLY